MYELSEIKQNLPTQYQTMLSDVSDYYPVIAKATKAYNKTQSQFMDNMMTLSQPTELRSLRQILAEVNKSKMALDEAYFGIEKKRIDIKKKQRAFDKETDDLEQELLTLEIAELESQIGNTMGYVEGAIRRISAYMNQYKTILMFLGKKEISEEDFEKDEERYHIMKAFEQALCAARSRQGTIDEGNHIYFYQIGINGTAAQVEIMQYLDSEGRQYTEGELPSHNNTWKWLHDMADKYQGSAQKLIDNKHMVLMDSGSMHQGG